MSKSRYWPKFITTFVLIAAFFAMQLTTTHAHLSGHNPNESGLHQHQIEAHTHNLAVHHNETISFSHPESREHSTHESVIVFDTKASLSKRKKQKNHSFFSVDIKLQSLLPSALISTKLPFDRLVTPYRLYYSQYNPRAPPQVS